MLIRNAELDGPVGASRIADVRIDRGTIRSIGGSLDAAAGEDVVDADGGALIPGLHDHHIHLFALAAAAQSTRCGPQHVRDERGLAAALTAATAAGGWIRGVGYHESVAGDLDRGRLDRWVPELRLRIQHRSGQAWFLNSAAVEYLGLDEGLGPDDPACVERDADGKATGRLFRADEWLAAQLPSTRPRLDQVGRALASFGVVGVTDATPANGGEELRAFGEAIDAGALLQRVHAMGRLQLPVSLHPDVTSAAVKIVLDERALPALGRVAADVASAHANGRSVAFHCVTRVELVLALGALEEAGAAPGDRIEHAGITPPESLDTIAALGVTVVTQPRFIGERGDSYLAEVEPRDLPWLYRCKSFDDAAVPLGGSTDAPYGSADPWEAMQSAVDRLTPSAKVLGADERLTPERALRLFTTEPQSPGGPARQIAVGRPADLCLLDAAWSVVADSLSSDHAVATWLEGRMTWQREGALKK